MAATINRVLLVLFLVSFVACAVLGNVALRERQRADRAEQRLAAATHQPVAKKGAMSGRTYRARNGVVLTAEDIAEAEAIEHQADKFWATVEYMEQKGRSKR
jgi:myo-inositol catabolism protein IolC